MMRFFIIATVEAAEIDAKVASVEGERNLSYGQRPPKYSSLGSMRMCVAKER